MDRSLLLAAAVTTASCRWISGVPEAELDVDAEAGDDLADAAPPDAGDREALCNLVDDDGDGLVDEGFDYVQLPGSERTFDQGDYAGLWWLAPGPDRFLAVWATGPGTAADVLSAQVFDLDGDPVAPAVTTNVAQPWSMWQPQWLEDRFVVAGTQREYACGGPASVMCTTYLFALDAAGASVLAPAPVLTATPWVGPTLALGGELLLPVASAQRTGPVRGRSFGRTGAAGAIDTDVIAASPGETIYSVWGSVVGAEIAWVYVSTTTGLSLRVTDLAGAPLRGPFSLGGGAMSVHDRGSPQVEVVDGHLLILFRDDHGPALGRWTLQGDLVGEVVPLGQVYPSGMRLAHDQLFVLTGENVDGEPLAQLWRLTPDLRVVQPGRPIGFAGGDNYAVLVGGNDGVIVAAAAAGTVDLPVRLAGFGCP